MMQLRVQISPRAYRAGEHLALSAELADGTYRKCPGRWRVLSSGEGPSLGIMRVFMYSLEPLDAVARATAANRVP